MKHHYLPDRWQPFVRFTDVGLKSGTANSGPQIILNDNSLQVGPR